MSAGVTFHQTVQCDRCRSTEHLITDDGPTICFPCVELLTDAAAHPLSVTSQLRDWLSELHGDVVRLIETDAGVAEWEWMAAWPGARA